MRIEQQMVARCWGRVPVSRWRASFSALETAPESAPLRVGREGTMLSRSRSLLSHVKRPLLLLPTAAASSSASSSRPPTHTFEDIVGWMRAERTEDRGTVRSARAERRE